MRSVQIIILINAVRAAIKPIEWRGIKFIDVEEIFHGAY